MRTIMVVSAAFALCLGNGVGALATEQVRAQRNTTASTSAATAATARSIPRGTPMRPGRLPVGPRGPVYLSPQDCRNVGGTVVVVADDRCGSTRQYCRMPDTNAVCIDRLS